MSNWYEDNNEWAPWERRAIATGIKQDLAINGKKKGNDMEHRPDVKAALSKAVAAIYFDDNSDYGTALWGIVVALGGSEAGKLLEEDESAAYAKYAEDI